jgi:DNA polymerase-3 subunit alpha
MRQFSEKFVAGAVKNGCAEGVAREIWENIVKFGGYGFNKSHSTAYAMITWQTAYLKAHHRIAFLAANMSCEMHNSDKIKEFVDDARAGQNAVLPPDIACSDWDFLPEGDAIRFGFGAIKGTGSRAIEALLAARESLRAERRRIDLLALCSVTDPNAVPRPTWEALIKAGTFDSTGHNRGAVLAALNVALAEGAQAASDRRAGQGTLFVSNSGEHGSADGIDDAGSFTREETLRAEYEALGFYLSGHPLEDRSGLFAILSSTSMREVQSLPGGSQVTLGGLIVALKENVTRAGKKMARFRLEDLYGGVNVTCFPRVYEEHRALLVEDSVVICRGKVEERGEDEASSAVGILLEGVLDFDSALRSFRGGLIIRLAPEDRAKVAELARLVEGHRGPHRLFFEVEGEDGRLRRVRSNERHSVNISTQLAQGIEGLLGSGRTKLARI